MKRTIVDTSVFIAAERRDLRAMERIDALLEAGALAVTAVTVVELAASPTRPAEWRAFYRDLFRSAVRILPVTADAAFAGTEAALRAGGAKAPDVLTAGVALTRGLTVIAADRDFARLMPEGAVELLSPS